jgi:DNA-binding transcriptional regulator YhcF (GntR family)
MAWSFTADRAVYLQIAERIKKSVLSGVYPPGEQIPSVRQLALEAAVNPNTVQKAFTELEDQGIILSRGTQGRFVTEDTETIEGCRMEMAQQYVLAFLQDIGQLGISREQAQSMIKEADNERIGM